jgi:cytochrome P450
MNPHPLPNLPPGPAAPFDVNVDEPTFRAMPAWFDAHGPIVRTVSPHGARDCYVIFDPDAIRRVLVTNHRNYMKGRGFQRVKMLLGNGLIVSEGKHWRRQRRMLQPAFQRPSVARLSETMRRVTLRCLDRWRAAAEGGRALDMTYETSAFALDVILESIFGEDLERFRDAAGGTPFHMLVDDTVRDLQLAVRFRALRGQVLELAEWRRSRGIERVDFLGMYLAARDTETGAPMSDESLMDEVMTLIVAGHETTGVTLNWIWHLLSHHPDAEARLHAEADALDADAPPRFADLERLPVARRIMDEALRLCHQIAILKDGVLSQVGRPEEILRNPADDYVEAFVRDVNRARGLSTITNP